MMKTIEKRLKALESRINPEPYSESWLGALSDEELESEIRRLVEQVESSEMTDEARDLVAKTKQYLETGVL